MKSSKRLLVLAISTALSAPAAVYATNGMNLEGYGPEALSMGGASMAYDNGTAAMMNNPATLGLAEDGSNRLDLALGFLGPDVSFEMPGMAKWDSGGDAYYMPAVGWAKKEGKLTYGVGAFAQGGMGTEYKSGTVMGISVPGGPGTFASQYDLGAFGSGPTTSDLSSWDEFSEVGVMRILVPLAYNVNDQLTIGGSIDYVRAGMDIKMAMPGSMMWDMMPTTYNPGATQAYGTISGTMVDGMMTGGFGPITEIYGGYFDFANTNDYTGEAEGDGFAGKIGFTHKVNDQFTWGATYHSETNLGDLEGDATVSMAVEMGGTTDMIMAVPGKIKIKDFQWPATYAVGMAFKPADKWLLVADVKRINWSDVMKDFKMSFTESMSGFGTVMDATMYQNWDDQTAVQLGGAYQVNDNFTVRLGANISDNPIPDTYLHYLFPAIIEDHYTAGFGYVFNPASSINFALSYAPEVKVTLGGVAEIKHSQLSWQLMYSHNF